ncbi:hypothetical protein [Nocardia sp. alder85J]|uniref:hypothetical protein n=1 Tax=Nocardia sp. alder85J TaxID=2862949 RepID=UPI001CD302E7|nr:hypothetical protein [Nocardia sp. alder85J]MCX4096322.1 hypothetical protein [Nocardia sp. alder85J]
MTDVTYGARTAAAVADFEPPVASTPLHRAAGRLQAVLPPGWRVDVVDIAKRHDDGPQPILRVRMPDNRPVAS